MARIVSVAAVNDYELIVAGLARLLAMFPDQLEVRERIVLDESPIDVPVDVALYDTYGRVEIDDALHELVAHEQIGAVAVFTLDLNEKLVADALVRVANGEVVLAGPPSPLPAIDLLDWPGKADGLSERESQVVVLAAEGLTNREIARALYLSTETVKSYLSQVFTKLGFRNRVEASAYVHQADAFERVQADVPRSARPEER
jgi:DNA-binding CsgD family transcriptional regulator